MNAADLALLVDLIKLRLERDRSVLLKGPAGEPGRTPVKGVDYRDGV